MIRKAEKILSWYSSRSTESIDRKKRYFDIYSNQTNIDDKKKEERKRKRYLDISIDRYRSDANDKGIKKQKTKSLNATTSRRDGREDPPSWNRNRCCSLSSARVAPGWTSVSRRRREFRGAPKRLRRTFLGFFFEYLPVARIPFTLPVCPFDTLRGTHARALTVLIHSCTSVFQYKQLASEFSPGPREWFLADVTAMLLSAIATPPAFRPRHFAIRFSFSSSSSPSSSSYLFFPDAPLPLLPSVSQSSARSFLPSSFFFWHSFEILASRETEWEKGKEKRKEREREQIRCVENNFGNYESISSFFLSRRSSISFSFPLDLFFPLTSSSCLHVALIF